MSIANGTTHYDYPQVQLTDRPVFSDFNPAFADIDAKLYGLITGAATDEQAIADLGTAVGGLRTDLGGVSNTATAAKNKADANEEAIGLLSTQVSQNTTKLGTKIDSNAIAEPYDTSATYAIDDIVTYQGQRYRCTTAVAVAEPFDATKWTGEDVQTVLEHLQDEIDDIPTGGTAADITLAPITGMSATNVQDGISELNNDLTGVAAYHIDNVVDTTGTVTLGNYAFVQFDMIATLNNDYVVSMMSPIAALPSDFYLTEGLTGTKRSAHITRSGSTLTIAPPEANWTVKVTQLMAL